MFRVRYLRVTSLLAVIAIFAFSSIISYQRYTEASKILDVTLKTGAWASSELEGELLRFLNTLDLFRIGERTPNDLMLRFDLLWSRIQVLRVGEETEHLRELPGAQEMLNKLDQLMKEVDPVVLNLQVADIQTAEQLGERYRTFAPAVRRFNVESFSGRTKLLELRSTHDRQHIFFLGLLISGAVLVLMLLRENARSRAQALHDPMTGLPNRKFFHDQLKIAEARSLRAGSRMAIYLIDLDDFKTINDSYGHSAGDRLLIEVARRLKDCVRQQDTVARLGGDEFAVIQEAVDHVDVSARLARRICKQIMLPIELNNNRVYPSASIGVSLFPNDSEKAEQVLINADTAMYLAKKDDGISYRFFEPEMNTAIVRRKRLSNDLSIAIKDNQLALFYQPIVNLNTGKIEATEALLRWHHEDYGYISPLEVVSIAEQFGLANQLNCWVLEQACRQNQRWIEQQLPSLSVSVNISPTMYTQYDLVGAVKKALAVSGMDANLLVLEVTEDTTMRDIETSPDILKKLRALDISLALDDFGTGYSSLSHLKRLPVQKLKIDKSFVQDLNNIPTDLRFIRTILSLAQSLELQVVAEGIEAEKNLKDLCLEGCHYGQGYLLSRPVQPNEMAELLKQQGADKLLFSCGNLTNIENTG
ncbi:bifunctional diguanylate cyclase/phosphodiesterase [Motiliproteus sp. MSK22-1]|uniref:putative bifunctional diguanylate cyclase/phosphodiesterase n=1 Tax=Motiliproteus sp. MSK22-1 TaxID=1897630 RepID=UPI00097669A6|nr:EAL domain-containing protein [Motiliproteus sp. MSK22-1]OMH27973.1 hypothetical protein BGP75_21585 [Motiliproteus sp. MSK22-1]